MRPQQVPASGNAGGKATRARWTRHGGCHLQFRPILCRTLCPVDGMAGSCPWLAKRVLSDGRIAGSPDMSSAAVLFMGQNRPLQLCINAYSSKETS